MGSSIDKVYMVMEYLENDLKTCMDMSASPFSMSEVRGWGGMRGVDGAGMNMVCTVM